MEKMIFDFDPSKCTACLACVMACMDQNDIDAAHHQHPFRNAAELESEDGGSQKFSFLSVACMHCEDAPCVMGCPSSCLYKDPESGLTLYDNTNCIGCKSCAMACPFGAPRYRKGDGKMVKCDGCNTRVKNGLKPACVRACSFGALDCVSEEEYRASGSDKACNQMIAHLGLRKKSV